MATVIDALVVTLGLDKKQFDRGRADVERDTRRTADQVRRQAREMEKAGDVAAQFYRKMRNGALSFFTVLIGGYSLLSFARDIVQTDAATGRFAHTLGMATDQVSMWQNAVKALGGTADEAQASIASLSREITGVNAGLKAPDSGFLQAIARIAPGVNPYGMTPDALLRSLAPGLARMGEAEAYQTGGMAGLSPGVVRLLRKGPAGLDQALREAKGRGVTTEADAERAQKFLNQLEQIEQRMRQIGRDFLEPLLPAITQFLEAVERFLKANEPFLKDTIAKAIIAIGKALESVHLDQVATQVDSIAQSLGGWETALTAIIGLWAGTKALRFLAALALLRGGPVALGGLASFLGVSAGLLSLEGDSGPNSGGLPDDASDAVRKRATETGAVSPGQAASYFAGIGGKDVSSDKMSRAREAVQFFMGKGWSQDDAAAIVGQMLWESGLNPEAVGDGGDSYGLLQWNKGRRNTAGALVGRGSIVGATFAEQLEAAHAELTRGGYKGVGDDLRAANGMLSKSAILTRRYLIPADPEGELAGRALMGSKAYRALPPNGIPATGPAFGPQRLPPPTAAPGGEKVSLNVGALNIYTQATDAKGIASEIRGAIDNQLAQAGIMVQANRGLV